MTDDRLTGYRGKLRTALETTGVEIGDKLEVSVNNQQYKGSLMPRVETYDEHHLIIKMVSGYNIGLAYGDAMKIKKTGTAPKPESSSHRCQRPKLGCPRSASSAQEEPSRQGWTT